MERNRNETVEILEDIFKESPAYLIDWLRANDLKIISYIVDMNKDITEFLKKIFKG